MSARTLLYKFLVVGPAVLVAGVGVHTRTYSDPFITEASRVNQQNVNAYIPLVRKTTWTLSKDSMTRVPNEIRVSAQAWIEGAKRGKLKPLTPVAYDDSPLDGVKGQIFNASCTLGRHLTAFAEKEAGRGQYEAALSDALMSLEIVQVAKYSAFSTVFQSDLHQRRSLQLLQIIWTKLSEEQKEKVRAALLETQAAQQPPTAILARTRLQYFEARANFAQEPLAVDRAGQPVTVGERDEDSRSGGVLVASKSDEIINYETEARLAGLAEKMIKAELDQLVASN